MICSMQVKTTIKATPIVAIRLPIPLLKRSLCPQEAPVGGHGVPPCFHDEAEAAEALDFPEWHFAREAVAR